VNPFAGLQTHRLPLSLPFFLKVPRYCAGKNGGNNTHDQEHRESNPARSQAIESRKVQTLLKIRIEAPISNSSIQMIRFIF